MKDTYLDGEKLARNGQKTASYYAASFLPHYRRALFLHLLVFNLWYFDRIKKSHKIRQEGWMVSQRVVIGFETFSNHGTSSI